VTARERVESIPYPPRPTLNRARNLAASEGVAYGIAYLFKNPRAYSATYFNQPKSIAPIHVWGAAFIVLGLLSFASPWLGRARQIPMGALAVCWGMYALPVIWAGLRIPTLPPTGGIGMLACAATALVAVRDSSPYRLRPANGEEASGWLRTRPRRTL
jgi:hypothetical protein